MFGFTKIKSDEKQVTIKSVLTKLGVVLAFLFLAFAIEKIGGTGEGKFFDVTKAVALVLYFVAYLLAGRKIIVQAFEALFKGKVVLDALIVTVGTLLCILLGQYIPAIIVMAIFYFGQSIKLLKE